MDYRNKAGAGSPVRRPMHYTSGETTEARMTVEIIKGSGLGPFGRCDWQHLHAGSGMILLRPESRRTTTVIGSDEAGKCRNQFRQDTYLSKW